MYACTPPHAQVRDTGASHADVVSLASDVAGLEVMMRGIVEQLKGQKKGGGAVDADLLRPLLLELQV